MDSLQIIVEIETIRLNSWINNWSLTAYSYVSLQHFVHTRQVCENILTWDTRRHSTRHFYFHRNVVKIERKKSAVRLKPLTKIEKEEWMSFGA